MKESLEGLVAAILRIIERGRDDGSWMASQQSYFRWRLEAEPKHTKNGVELSSARGETIVKSSWSMATALVAQREVPQTTEFERAVSSIRTLPKIGEQAAQHVQQFAFTVARRASELGSRPAPNEFGGLVARFVDDLEGKPFECGAQVELDGLAVESETIELAHGVVLRRPKRQDFEREAPYYGPGPNPESDMLTPISAVARIVLTGTSPRDAQRAVDKFVALLRLFKVASVKYVSYDLFGESIVNLVWGRLRSGNRDVIYERGFISSDDEPHLLRFWHTLDPILPEAFYDSSPSAWDYRDMAYERYCAALMKPGSIEERVASAVMGLEALFLEEHLELAYRLRVRAAKLLGFLGERPADVRDAINDAYGVRSTFAHGGRLSSKDKRKLEGRYQSVGGIVPLILNFVRKTIIAILVARWAKDDLIELIDDALIERSAEDRLGQLLLPVADVV